MVFMPQQPFFLICPHCTNNDPTMFSLLGYLMSSKGRMYLCEVCSRAFKVLDDDTANR
jgi:hypothetical protein